MRKIAIGLVVGAATLAGPAVADDAQKPPAKVEVNRVQGGAVRSMNKTDLKEHKSGSAIQEHKAPSAMKEHKGGVGASQAAERTAPKKIRNQ